jgi:predicted metal-dependent hydrolase
MIKPSRIIFSKRKTVTLTVDSGCNLIVKAPKNLALSEIDNFIREKESWIKNKINFYGNINTKNAAVKTYKEVLCFGKKFEVVFGAAKEITLDGDSLIAPLRLNDSKKFINALKRWYKENALEIFTVRTDMFCRIMKLKYEKIKINDSKKTWGSCDSNKNISYNFRTVMLPPSIIDYIIVHELSHLRHLNHSAKFWAEVAKYIPNWKEHRKVLKDNQYLMELYREKRAVKT